ncbi:MAG TPA: RNA methyltransferase [Nitrolancea sp.]|nr:RNA methyltransferase [Nitrolancea sp.]
MTAELISSKNNAHIKNIRKLRTRGERDQYGLFFVEGIRQVSEAIQTGIEIEELVIAPELLTSEFALDLVERELARGTDGLLVAADVFQSISEREHAHGLGAVMRQRWEPLDDIKPSSDTLWIGLDTVADPGNLGSILRTSDAVGGTGVILIGRTTDPYDPNAVRASMGAIFSQRLVRTTTNGLIAWTKQHHPQVIGTSPAAADDYQSAEYQAPILLLMGSERHGLPDELLQICDPLVKLPMEGRSDSLNLSVATGVMLYEIFNQRRRSRTDATASPPSGRSSRRTDSSRPERRSANNRATNRRRP